MDQERSAAGKNGNDLLVTNSKFSAKKTYSGDLVQFTLDHEAELVKI